MRPPSAERVPRTGTRDTFDSKAALHAIGNEVASMLRMLESFRELISVGELAVAVEKLCTNLTDMNADVSPETLASIQSAGERLAMGPRYWERLTGH